MRTIVVVTVGILLGELTYLAGSPHVSADGPPTAHAVDAAACMRLTSRPSNVQTGIPLLVLPNTKITSAQVVPAGQFKPPAGAAEGFADLPEFCRVDMTLTPSSDSDIKSETWLPLSGWNGKFQEVGNGGWNGFIQYGALAAALRRGYATASTDTGHTGDTASFAPGHPEKLIDFGYRAIHETAVQAKRIVAALYSAPPQLSYFTGCSGGGRQAFMEAQRYPQDFEAIIAGDPGYARTDESFQLVAAAQALHKDAASEIPKEKFAVLHQAALDACDALDGIKDGIINDPRVCKFDPAVTQCKGADGPNCLTAAQVEAARKLYRPLMDPKTGKEVFPGFEPGTEMRFAGSVGGPRPLGMADDLFKYVVFNDPNWDYRTLDVRKDLERARKIDNGEISPVSANLRPYVGRGSKLIIYHGWADQNVAPLSSVHYYEQLVSELGQKQVEDSVRLYMAPGMGHCGGGEGPSVFDTLTPLEQWREHGVAPKEIIASQIADGKIIRTRPLCPYPQEAQYKGAGSPDQADNFVCRTP